MIDQFGTTAAPGAERMRGPQDIGTCPPTFFATAVTRTVRVCAAPPAFGCTLRVAGPKAIRRFRLYEPLTDGTPSGTPAM